MLPQRLGCLLAGDVVKVIIYDGERRTVKIILDTEPPIYAGRSGSWSPHDSTTTDVTIEMEPFISDGDLFMAGRHGDTLVVCPRLPPERYSEMFKLLGGE